MSSLETQYKALPLEDRLNLALSDDLPEVYRPFMVREQWMVVKCYFARRADLSVEEVGALLADQDHVIRLCIAKRPDLTSEMVDLCVNDRDPNVRHAISRNPNITEAQRIQLRNDSDPLVAHAAAKPIKSVAFRQRPGQARLIK